MPATLTYNYVYFEGGSTHKRQPRASTAYGGFQPIGNLSGSVGTLVAGTPFSPPQGALPPDQTIGTATYQFAFVNVSGGTQGGQTSFKIAEPPQITVGTSPIVVLVVYLPTGNGGHGGGTGASIDAFDESTGNLVDDTFVGVTTDQSLTGNANVFGWVPTTSAETIQAYSYITTTMADFDQWVNLAGGLSPAGVNFTATKNTNYYALAFYKTPPTQPVPVLSPCQTLVQSLQKMIAIGIPGPLFTVAEWQQVLAQLRDCVLQHQITQAQANTLIAGYETYSQARNQPPTPTPPGVPKV